MRILVIVPPERFDFYDFLKQDKSNDFILLWHEKPEQLVVDLATCPLDFKEFFFWQQFPTPKILIQTIAPDKILFFEILDLRQIALIVSAKAGNVPTFYMDHGAAGNVAEAVSRYSIKGQFVAKLPYLIARVRHNLLDSLKAKYFYFSVVRPFSSIRSYLMYLIFPFALLRTMSTKVLAQYKFRERSPDYYIVFNKLNLEELSHFHKVCASDTFLTGVPNFDNYFTNSPDTKDYVVFIDHPYLEQGLYNWTDEFHQLIATELNKFAVSFKVKVFIKLHPRSNKSRWLSYAFDNEFVEILQTEDCTQLYLESLLILGFSSSLLTAFLCAHKNVVLLGWHPEAKIHGYDFSETGLCYNSLKMSDLSQKFSTWISQNLSFNEVAYKQFIEFANPSFDGNAGKRIINLISDIKL